MRAPKYTAICWPDLIQRHINLPIFWIISFSLDAKNDRLWFKTNTKLGKLYYDREEFIKLAKILRQLHQSCQVSQFLFMVAEKNRTPHWLINTFSRLKMVKMTWRKELNFLRYMLLKYKCTLHRKITKNSRGFMNNRYISNLPFLTLW